MDNKSPLSFRGGHCRMRGEIKEEEQRGVKYNDRQGNCNDGGSRG